MKIARLLTVLVVANWCSAVHAHVTVSDAWSRSTTASQSAGVAYMHMVAGHDTTLIGGVTPAADAVQIHQSQLKGGVATMTQLLELPLKKGVPIKFEPRGLHVMLVNLKRRLNAGEKVPLRLDFRNSDGTAYSQDFVLEVRALAPIPSGGSAVPKHVH